MSSQVTANKGQSYHFLSRARRRRWVGARARDEALHHASAGLGLFSACQCAGPESRGRGEYNGALTQARAGMDRGWRPAAGASWCA
jgi:hypothetical protein